jgi:hypothetical protein
LTYNIERAILYVGGTQNVKRKKKKGWSRADKLALVGVLVGAAQLVLAILSYLIMIR